MAKSLKKSLAMLIVALMTVGMFAPQALAAEITTTTDTQTTTEGGITTTVTTTTETTVDGENTTIVVTIDTVKTGTDETGAPVDYHDTVTETMVTTTETDDSTEPPTETTTETTTTETTKEGTDETGAQVDYQETVTETTVTTTETDDSTEPPTETTTETTTTETTKEYTDETGAQVDYQETVTETTITETLPDGSVETTETTVTDGSETLEWDEIPDEEDLPEGVELPEYEEPEVEVEIIPGETTTGSGSVEETETSGDVSEGADDVEYDYTDVTVTVDKDVTVEASDIETEVITSETDLTPVAPENYDGKHLDGSTGVFTGTGADLSDYIQQPGGIDIDGDGIVDVVVDGYDYQVTGHAEATNAVRAQSQTIVFVKDEDGNPIVIDPENFDPSVAPNGYATYPDGTPMIIEGKYLVESMTPDGKYGNGMDSSPCIFLLTKYDENGDPESYYYAYCIDKDTEAYPGAWYTVSNLEDSDYYPNEESAAMLRSVVTNGYWGQASGTGSLDNMISGMQSYYGEGATVTVMDKDGNPITFTVEELLASVDEADALTATQAAIWSYSNGSIDTRNGTDGTVVTGLYSVDKPKSNLMQCVRDYDYARDARLKMAYDYLMSLEGTAPDEGATVINEDNFIDDMSIVVGDKVAEVESTDENGDTVTNGVYETALNFTLAFIPGENDDLLMQLKYTDLDGNEQIIIKRLAGTNEEGESFETIARDEDGSYTISGLKLSENEDFNFDLRLEGTQHLEKGVYVYSSYVSDAHPESQTLVGMAEGTQTVAVSASMTVSFSVDEENHVVAERHWHDEEDPTTITTPPPPPPQEDNPPPEEELPPPPPDEFTPPPPEEEIPDEPVPLSDVPYTGDDSAMWLLVIGPAGMGLVALKLSDKKREDEEI